jgi:four helix bundle protein
MNIEKFEDILAWQKAGQLSVLIYRTLQDSRDYDFRSQIQRAAVSVMNNIAEGFERRSNKDFKNFLFIAKGSCAEVRSMAYLGCRLEYFDEKCFKDIYNLSTEISKMISGLIKTL